MAKHSHHFKRSMHLDGCHYIMDVAVCACGATQARETERDPSRDPYALIWFGEDCVRCTEIRGGADLRWTFRQTGPKGRTTRKEESIVAQEKVLT
jgi:hypothetical protein